MQRTQLKLCDRSTRYAALYSAQLTKPVWMSAEEIGALFHKRPSAVCRCLTRIMEENGLDPRQYTRPESSGGAVGRPCTTLYYNLDLVLLLSFRIQGSRGDLVRAWASRVLCDYLIKGYTADAHTFPHLFYAHRQAAAWPWQS